MHTQRLFVLLFELIYLLLFDHFWFGFWHFCIPPRQHTQDLTHRLIILLDLLIFRVDYLLLLLLDDVAGTIVQNLVKLCSEAVSWSVLVNLRHLLVLLVIILMTLVVLVLPVLFIGVVLLSRLLEIAVERLRLEAWLLLLFEEWVDHGALGVHFI